MNKKYIKIIVIAVVIIIIAAGAALWYQKRGTALSPEELSENLSRLDMIDDSPLPDFEMPLWDIFPPLGIAGDFQVEISEEIEESSIRVEAPAFE